MDNETMYIEVLQPDRCPLCFLLHDYVHEHLKSLLDESVTDPISREALFRSNGFCRKHAWLGVQQGRHLGMAVIYGSLLERGLEDLGRGPKFWKKHNPFLGSKDSAGTCPICDSEQKRERSHIQQFVLAWEESEKLRSAFAERGILCLNHLENILSQKINSTHRQKLLETGKKALATLLKDLNEFLEKQDYHRSHEAFGKERDAWIRVVRMVSGERE